MNNVLFLYRRGAVKIVILRQKHVNHKWADTMIADKNTHDTLQRNNKNINWEWK